MTSFNLNNLINTNINLNINNSTTTDFLIKNLLGINNSNLQTNEVNEMLEKLNLVNYNFKINIKKQETLKDKKLNEYVKRYLEEIKFIMKNSDNVNIFKNNKEKNFSNYLKPDVKTKIYNTVKDDNLSLTLSAYYNCEKNRNIFSDIEAAALKAYKPEVLNNDYIEETNINIRYTEKKVKEKEKEKEKDVNKEFDNVKFI